MMNGVSEVGYLCILEGRRMLAAMARVVLLADLVTS